MYVCVYVDVYLVQVMFVKDVGTIDKQNNVHVNPHAHTHTHTCIHTQTYRYIPDPPDHAEYVKALRIIKEPKQNENTRTHSLSHKYTYIHPRSNQPRRACKNPPYNNKNKT